MVGVLLLLRLLLRLSLLLLRCLLALPGLLLMLGLERSKKRLVACELLRSRDAVDTRTSHVSVGHLVLLAGILRWSVLIVGVRHALHVRCLSRCLVLTHVCLRNTLRVHVRDSKMTIPDRHWHLLPLLVRHLSVYLGLLLSRRLTTLCLLRSLRPLLVRHTIRHALRCAHHLSTTLPLSFKHLRLTLTVDLDHRKIPLVTCLAEFLRRRHRTTLLWCFILLRGFPLGCGALRLSLFKCCSLPLASQLAHSINDPQVTSRFPLLNPGRLSATAYGHVWLLLATGVVCLRLLHCSNLRLIATLHGLLTEFESLIPGLEIHRLAHFSRQLLKVDPALETLPGGAPLHAALEG